MIKKEIESTIVRLRAIRDDGQLTDGLRERVTGVIEALEEVAHTCEGDPRAKRMARYMVRELHRLGWWLLLQRLNSPDDPGPEC